MLLDNVKIYGGDDIRPFIKLRKGEQKLGETIVLTTHFSDVEAAIEKFQGRYVLLGIPEDIGPRANFGKPGAHTAFKDFLGSFLNMQDNLFLTGNKILLLGEVKLDDLMRKASEMGPGDEDKLRVLVEEIDHRVSPVIYRIVNAGKIPVVIGGGHNNAYPVLKGAYLAHKATAIGVVNIDPHADLRNLEGRHSGNGFSYAVANGYIDKYFAIGLHENYNNEYTWNTLDADKNLFAYLTYEEIQDKNLGTKEICEQVHRFMKKLPVGLEIDMDCMQYTECSAKTPVGFSPGKVRKLIRKLTRPKNIVYINISEGIASSETQTGKLTAYLVTEFIRALERS